MLISDFHKIGDRLHELRKKKGMTQLDVAVAAKLSDRTYADIERGSVNMKMDTFLKICKALGTTPDEILVNTQIPYNSRKKELLNELDKCTLKEQNTALNLLSVYLDSVL